MSTTRNKASQTEIPQTSQAKRASQYTSKRDFRHPVAQPTKVRSTTERFITRTTTGFIYLAVTVACLLLGPLATAILIAAEAWLCCSEFFRMMRGAGRMPNDVLGLFVSAAIPLSLYFFNIDAFVLLLTFSLLGAAAWFVFMPWASVADVAVTIFAPIYTSFPLSTLVLLRLHDPSIYGALLPFIIMLSIAANDSFAYLVGSLFGTHKLTPRISPKKSVEGFIAGILSSALVWLVASLFGIMPLVWYTSMGVGMLVAIVSVLGDLFESRIKRGIGVKDAGTLMPGHGGLLDRNDSMIFGCFVAYVCLLFGGVI